MTTLCFWCTHELYSKNKLPHSTIESHLSLRHNRHHLVNRKCLLHTVSRVSSDQNYFPPPPQQYNYISNLNFLWIFNKGFNCSTWTLIVLKCTEWLLSDIYITVDPTKRPQQAAMAAAAPTEHQRPCTSLSGVRAGGTYHMRREPIGSIQPWFIHSCTRHLSTFSEKVKSTNLRKTKMLEDVFFIESTLAS